MGGFDQLLEVVLDGFVVGVERELFGGWGLRHGEAAVRDF
jgi:hypothetical protein